MEDNLCINPLLLPLLWDACSHSGKASLILLPFSSDKMDMLVLQEMRLGYEHWFIFPLDSICIILSINSKGMTRCVISFWIHLIWPCHPTAGSLRLPLQLPGRKIPFSQELPACLGQQVAASVCWLQKDLHSSSSDSSGRVTLNPMQEFHTGTSKAFKKRIPYLALLADV